MQHSVENGAVFKTVVAEWPTKHPNLDSFIANAEQLVLDQIEWRAQNRGMPRRP
jgi:hypothetical protein